MFRGYYGVVHNNSFIVSLQSDNLSKDYLYAVLNSDFVRKQALSLAKNSAQPDLTHDMFKSIVIPVPTKKKQIEVAAVYNFLSQKIEENTAVNDNLANHSAMVASPFIRSGKRKSRCCFNFLVSRNNVVIVSIAGFTIELNFLSSFSDGI